jgi:hypothetical protein
LFGKTIQRVIRPTIGKSGWQLALVALQHAGTHRSHMTNSLKTNHKRRHQTNKMIVVVSCVTKRLTVWRSPNANNRLACRANVY